MVPPLLQGVKLVKCSSPSETVDAEEALANVPALALYFSVSSSRRTTDQAQFILIACLRLVTRTRPIYSAMWPSIAQAHWCPPCQRFTPILSDLYGEVNEDSKQLEVVFVSSDDDEAQWTGYMKHHGDWLSVPYAGELRAKLKRQVRRRVQWC